MATIYNSDLSKELADGAKIQLSKDSIPTQLAEKVVPVMEVNPKLLRRINVVANISATNSTVATLYTAPTDKDFFLVAATLSCVKDATSTSTNSTVTLTAKGGANARILDIVGLTLTAMTGQQSISYPNPILIERGTTIQVRNTTNVANVTASATIQGYLVDASNS